MQLHFGGAHPPSSCPAEIRLLGAIDPFAFHLGRRTWKPASRSIRAAFRRDHLDALREVGFNRASIGVQDHNPVVQKAVHRIQPFEQTQKVVDWIRATGLSVPERRSDLRVALSDARLLRENARILILLKPDRLAVFSYAHVPWMKPAQKDSRESSLPTPETSSQMLKLIIEKLTSPATCISAWTISPGRMTNWPAQRQQNAATQFPGIQHAGRTPTSTRLACRRFRRRTAFTGRTRKIFGAITPRWMPASCRFAKGYILTADDKLAAKRSCG